MDMYGEQRGISEKLKSTDRRLKTLDEHLRHSGNYKAYRRYKAQFEKLYAQYRAIKKAGGFGAEQLISGFRRCKTKTKASLMPLCVNHNRYLL